MRRVFSDAYSVLYDSMYRAKDYEAECDLVETVFARYGSGLIHRIVDFGCGTGNHLIPLARRGYEVVGMDRSAAMLTQARVKCAKLDDLQATFVLGEVRDGQAEGTFDAALMMFAVLGYQLTDEDLAATLGNVRRHLRLEGLFLFDVWFGPAVLSQGLSERSTEFSNAERVFVRRSHGTLDPARNVCSVHIEIDEKGEHSNRLRMRELHEMRYFFRPELTSLLTAAGFDLLSLGAFPNISREPTVETWTVLGIARAVSKGER